MPVMWCATRNARYWWYAIEMTKRGRSRAASFHLTEFAGRLALALDAEVVGIFNNNTRRRERIDAAVRLDLSVYGQQSAFQIFKIVAA